MSLINSAKYDSLATEIENNNEEIVDRVLSVDIDKIIPNEKNFYDEDYEIESLAEQIKMSGQLEPIITTKEYKLISGHRRYKAIKLLGKATINCRILKDINDEDDEQIKLIQANAYRTKSSEEIREEVLRLTEIYTRKYNAGEITKGAITLLTAEDVGRSQRQVQRLAKELKSEITDLEIEAIQNNLDLSEYNELKANDKLSIKGQHDYLAGLLKLLKKETKTEKPVMTKQKKLDNMVLKLSRYIEANSDELDITSELYNAAIDHVVVHNQTNLNI